MNVKTTLCLPLIVVGLFLCTSIYAAGPITNDECLGCHGEKGLEKTTKAGKKVSLFVDVSRFKNSVHGGSQCVNCHDVKEVPHPESVKVAACDSCHKDPAGQFKGSVHAGGKGGSGARCQDCHGHHDVQKPKSLTAAVCSTCHNETFSEYRTGVHARIAEGREIASCWSCHGSHQVYKKSDPRSSMYPLNLPRTCSVCHGNPEIVKKYKIPAGDVYKLYMDSIHGRAITKSGLLVSANCSDCHGAHAIKPHTDPTSKIYWKNVSHTCGKCHAGTESVFSGSIHGSAVASGNEKAPHCATCHPPHQVASVESKAWVLDIIRECGTCHADLLKSYRHTYHGKVTALGFTRVAKCVDCHGSHDILPAYDPRSSIAPKHRLETCTKCHPGANSNFARFIVHADYKDRLHYPGLYYVWLFMTILLVGVFGFFGIHALLWLPRSWIDRIRRRRGKRQTR